MPKEKLKTLTEPMYYILLSLTKECCGVDIMQRIQEISNMRVSVGPGTLYTLLGKFLDLGLIIETNVEGRKRSYIISDLGKKMLVSEFARLQSLVADGKEYMEGL